MQEVKFEGLERVDEMAKLNIELDLDYLEEGQNIEDFVHDEIISAATRRIESTVTEIAKEKLRTKIEGILDIKVGEITTKIIDDFITTQKFPCPKNSYDSSPEYKSIPEILVQKLEKSLMKKVDKDGRETDYNSVGTRFDWLTGKLAERYADEKVKEATRDFKAHIEKFILEKVKGEIMTQLSSEILKNIDFGKIK